MVKKIDEPEIIDHIGVDLWRAALAWRKRLHDEMVARGYAWYGDARSVVAMHLAPGGMPQSELVQRVGLTKQAVQQLLDALEADGVVRREPNPEDRRSKRVIYTAKGLAALREANTIKRDIEADFLRRLGPRGLANLRKSLAKLTEE